MPPLIVAVLLGAGAYAGFRAVRHLLSRSSEEGMPPAEGGNGNPTEPEKDLGRLELDPATGVYRPVPPVR
jgi:hypothetical protein